MSGPCSAKPLRGANHELAELGNLWHSIGAWLFPVLEDELGELDDRHREFIAICEVDVPISWLVTSARMHDSQAAIPLARMVLGGEVEKAEGENDGRGQESGNAENAGKDGRE